MGRLIQGGDPKQLRGCSYDLRIGTILFDDQMHSGADRPVVVPPGGLVSIMTKEIVALPDDVCATAFAINQLSSKGFLVLNPGHVDPGFVGALTIKALNVRKVPMTLTLGANIFTLIFERLPKPTFGYKHNNPDHDERLRAFYATTVETSPKTLFEVMKGEKDGPFPSRDEVERMIRNHWMGWLTLFLAGVAAYKAIFPSAPVEISKPRPTAPAVAQSVAASATLHLPAAPSTAAPAPTPPAAKDPTAGKAKDGK